MFDVLCAIDPRFTGGTPAAMASDITAFLGAGLKVGVVPVRSSYLDDMPSGTSRKMQQLLSDDRVELLDPLADGVISARTLFLHHPMTFFYGIEAPLNVRAERAFMVAHHPPFRGDGSLQYDPVATSRRVHAKTGVRPVWLPVSGVCRQQLQSFHPFVRISDHDWPNVFDLDDWVPTRPAFSGERIVIGRHSRADALKWPGSAADIAASLPAMPESDIRVMGCPREALEKLGADMQNWTVYDFDEVPVPTFLDGLDVFAYHYHPAYTECFGRTVAEAMLMGAVCVLDPRLEPTFGALALYCEPKDTTAVIESLRADPIAARALAARARAEIIARHGMASVMPRLNQLFAPLASASAASPPRRQVPPHQVLKKLVGMVRRREYFVSQLSPKEKRHG